MQKIRIVADSTCDYDPTLIQSDELDILPLTITIDDQNYMDREEISVSDVYEAIRSGSVPKTSQITYGRTYDLFRSLLDSGSDIIYLTFSGEMSGCYSLAVFVAEELRELFPDRKLAVIDTKGGSGATGLMALQVLKMVRSGMSFETIVQEAHFMANHVEHVFSVGDIEWLAKGGRISKIVGYVGSKIDAHPLIFIDKGRMSFLKMILGKKKVIQAVADEIVKRADQFQSQLISICHGDDLVSAKKLEELIRHALPDSLTTVCHIGGVVGVHIGLKGIGAFCFNKRPPNYCLT